MRYKKIAEELWQLLDNIDTSSDIIKPEKSPFYKYVMKMVCERHNYLTSNGYKLRR